MSVKSSLHMKIITEIGTGKNCSWTGKNNLKIRFERGLSLQFVKKINSEI